MAQIRGVEIGKILRTPADVIEHCYPELHKRNQGLVSTAAAPSAAPVVEPPPSAPARAPKSKSKKAKSAKVEETPASQEPAGYDPFKD